MSVSEFEPRREWGQRLVAPGEAWALQDLLMSRGWEVGTVSSRLTGDTVRLHICRPPLPTFAASREAARRLWS